MVKGEKTPPIVEFVIQAKFEEEKVHHTKELNLKVHGLPKTNTPLQAGHTFLYDAFDLKNISLQKAWTTLDDTLVIWFLSTKDHLQALRTKTKLFSFIENLLG